MGHLILYEVNNILILILQWRKRVLIGILELAPNHPAGKWCGQDLSPVIQIPKSMLWTTPLSTSSFLWNLLALTSRFWMLSMAFCSHQWCQKREMCLGLYSASPEENNSWKAGGSLLPLCWRCQSKLDTWQTPISAGNSLCGRQTNSSQTGKGSAPWFCDFPSLFPGLSAGSCVSVAMALWTVARMGFQATETLLEQEKYNTYIYRLYLWHCM